MKAKFIFSLFVLLILGGGTVAAAQTYSYYGSNCYVNCDPYYYQQQGYYYPSSSTIALSQSNITLGVGQVATIYVYGGSARTTTSSNWGVIQHALFNNVITIQGLAQGSTTLSVCSDGYEYYQNNCAHVNVSVRGSGYNYNYNYPYNYPYYYQDYNYPYHYENDLLDRTSIRIDKGDREELDITTRGSYRDVYVDDNSDDRVASAKISGDQLVIRGLRRGSTDIRICDDYTCSTLEVTVRD